MIIVTFKCLNMTYNKKALIEFFFGINICCLIDEILSQLQKMHKQNIWFLLSEFQHSN